MYSFGRNSGVSKNIFSPYEVLLKKSLAIKIMIWNIGQYQSTFLLLLSLFIWIIYPSPWRRTQLFTHTHKVEACKIVFFHAYENKISWFCLVYYTSQNVLLLYCWSHEIYIVQFAKRCPEKCPFVLFPLTSNILKLPWKKFRYVLGLNYFFSIWGNSEILLNGIKMALYFEWYILVKHWGAWNVIKLYCVF